VNAESAISAYLKPRIAVMLALGFSSGLPFLLIFGTLSAWLREEHVTRTTIGLMSYAGLGYAIKFLWAPVLDQVRVPFLDTALGKRRAWMLVSQIAVAAALIAQSGQYLFGDEANLTAQLPGFVTLNLSTSYRLTPHIQFFASVENVTAAKYYTYGTFSPTTAVYLAQAPNATNPRAYSPAAPIGGFGGVRVVF